MKVVNLSSVPLTQSKTNLLYEGLRFSPISGDINKKEFNKDMDNLERILRLKVHFGKKFNGRLQRKLLSNTVGQDFQKKKKQIDLTSLQYNCTKAYRGAIPDEIEYGSHT